jgi:hypothetical protein
MPPKQLFICADHGLAVIYFLQSDVLSTLLDAGLGIVVLTDDALVEGISERFGRKGVIVEGMRLKEANTYTKQNSPEIQWWLHFLRRVGSSSRINTEAQDAYLDQVAVEEGWKRRTLIPFARIIVGLLRRSWAVRRMVVNAQQRFIPGLYADLFEKYQPSMVITSTYGWRQDRYLLREAYARGVTTAAAIVGWDNPSSYGLPATPVNWITCWSEVQKEELTLGNDFSSEQVNIGGIPSYDGYFRKTWLMSRDEYFHLHGLDPHRKLISYAASFVSFAPNYRNIETLAHLVTNNALVAPAQLLIRLHPNHFWNNQLFAAEREKIRQLAHNMPHVHVVEPVPLGGSLGYYSGEDMPEKSSMMAYSDVFTTVYSTMVVEAATHNAPIVSICLDIPGGWNTFRKFSLPLAEIGNWPTHQRFREAKAGRVALTEAELCQALNTYLENPTADLEARRAFLQREITFTDGSAGRRTGEFFLSRLGVI